MKKAYVFCSFLGILFSITVAAQAQIGSLNLIPAGATWKYLDDGSDQGEAWRAADFDDSAWMSGPAQLGYGDGDEVTPLSFGPNEAAKFVTTYFRHAFTLDDPAALSDMEMLVLRDDGVIVYINGSEVWRDNMPAGPVGFNTFAFTFVSGGDESTFFPALPISNSVLVAGTNVIAVEIHQSDPDSSDISFDLSLSATVSSGPAQILTQPVSASVFEGATATFTVEAAGAAPLSYQWQVSGMLIEGATNAVLTISGVTTNDAGFYRVVVSNSEGTDKSSIAELVVLDAGSGLLDDFEPDIDLVQWLEFGGEVLATNYGGSVSGPNSLWFGGNGDRFATTRPLNTTAGGTISFALRISDGDSFPWEDATLPSEGVVLEYSNDNGLNYQVLLTMDTVVYNSWTTELLTIPGVAQGTATLFRWRQLGNSGSNFDHWALDDVQIAVGPSPPSIFQEPSDLTVASGGTATLRVEASGSLPLVYQWEANGLDIPGGTNATLEIRDVLLTDAGIYRVRISNDLGMVVSRKTTLTVVELVGDFFRIKALNATGFRTVPHESFTGDDRGGIGASSSQVFYTGDRSTARFSLDDLSGRVELGTQYDVLVSDLRT
jgi:hypothetical protein